MFNKINDDIDGNINKNNNSIIVVWLLFNLYKTIKLIILIKHVDQTIRLKKAKGKNGTVLLFWFCNQFNCPNTPINNKKREIIELKNIINKKLFFNLYNKLALSLIISSSLFLYK